MRCKNFATFFAQSPPSPESEDPPESVAPAPSAPPSVPPPESFPPEAIAPCACAGGHKGPLQSPTIGG